MNNNRKTFFFFPVFSKINVSKCTLKLNAAGLRIKDGTGDVGAVICDRAAEVFAALSERVCDSSLIKRTCITPLSYIVQWSHVAEFSGVIAECEDAGMIMHLQM